jgi:hypothetical protein
VSEQDTKRPGAFGRLWGSNKPATEEKPAEAAAARGAHRGGDHDVVEADLEWLLDDELVGTARRGSGTKALGE